MQEGKPYGDKFILINTWDVGLPMIYKDEDGNIIKLWKNGTREIIKEGHSSCNEENTNNDGLFLNEENEGAYADDLID